MKFVEEMTKEEREIAVFGVGFKRDAQGRPIEQGRGTPGNPHADSHGANAKEALKELQRNAIIQATIDGKVR